MAQQKTASKAKPLVAKPTPGVHPGELLNDELVSRKIKKSAFAAKLGVRPSHLSDVLYGNRHISPSFAVRLEKQLKIDAAYWLEIQMYYDLKVARKRLRA
ncbi:MAG TPA: HigA family addiction module antitoxin [Chitinophagales bacterium]|nr:HigA family addiction module antitoxin [Chitinophagales bacterium]